MNRKAWLFYMSKEKQNAQELTKSQAKRAARKKEAEAIKKQARRSKAIWTGVTVLILFVLSFGIGFSIYKQVNKVKPNNDFSKYLTDSGYIKDVNASEAITLPEYKGVKVPLSELEMTEEEIEADIQTQLDKYPHLNEDPALAAADGDELNIDYVGTIDGEEFQGGSAEGADLTLGSNTFIDDFEAQLVGHKPGETVEVQVTFPEDYSSAELAAKDAVFTVTINGIYEPATFDDAFVAENLTAYADTVEGYKQYLKDKHYESSLDSWIADYLTENTTVNSYPNAYVKQLKNLEKYNALQAYETTNEYYSNYYGYTLYNSFADYVQMSETEYDKSLKETCEAQAKNNLIYQAIAEAEGFAPTSDEYFAYLESKNSTTQESYDRQLETYGTGYVVQAYLKEFATNLIKENVIVE